MPEDIDVPNLDRVERMADDLRYPVRRHKNHYWVLMATDMEN